MRPVCFQFHQICTRQQLLPELPGCHVIHLPEWSSLPSLPFCLSDLPGPSSELHFLPQHHVLPRSISRPLYLRSLLASLPHMHLPQDLYLLHRWKLPPGQQLQQMRCDLSDLQRTIQPQLPFLLRWSQPHSQWLLFQLLRRMRQLQCWRMQWVRLSLCPLWQSLPHLLS
jgi:hypothetical protein